MLSLLHRPANLTAIDAWLEEALPAADFLILSVEMFVYGGLITSRESNATTAACLERASRVTGFRARFPNLRGVFASSVVMRIPAYNGDFEEPWYWASYGYDLYEYSFYTSRYNAEGQLADEARAAALARAIPENVMSQFLWRRQRNYNVSVALLGVLGHEQQQQQLQQKRGGAGSYDDDSSDFSLAALYITEDDSGDFGFNVDEAHALQGLAFDGEGEGWGLPPSLVKIYPGADEVAAILLSRLAVAEAGPDLPSESSGVARGEMSDRAADSAGGGMPVCVAYRLPAAKDLVPNYESQNLSNTVAEQVSAGGGALVLGEEGTENKCAEWLRQEGSSSSGISMDIQGKVVLLVNNFEGQQLEASQQPRLDDYDDDHNDDDADPDGFSAAFLATIEACDPTRGDVIAFADSRYSNGGDMALTKRFLRRLLNQTMSSPSSSSYYPCLVQGRWAYAGWNTNGNTLGTAIANGILLAINHRTSLDFSTTTTTTTTSSSLSSRRAPALQLAARQFTLLRLLEDLEYQADVRQVLIPFVQASEDDTNDLASGPAYGDGAACQGSASSSLSSSSSSSSSVLDFYEQFTMRPLASRALDWLDLLGIPSASTALASTFYPWNRTFEIGFTLAAPTLPQMVTAEERAADKYESKREETEEGTIVDCDIVVAGGSTAALAAAIAAVDESAHRLSRMAEHQQQEEQRQHTVQVCLTEPSDWVGGQLTSSLVTAVDFGLFNRLAPNLPYRFKDALAVLGFPEDNPGSCWVSTFCYEAGQLLRRWIQPELEKRANSDGNRPSTTELGSASSRRSGTAERLRGSSSSSSSSSNSGGGARLKVLTGTVVKAVTSSSETGAIEEVVVVQRSSSSSWSEASLDDSSSSSSSSSSSASILDWYSTTPSREFPLKRVLRLRPSRSRSAAAADDDDDDDDDDNDEKKKTTRRPLVVIDGSELGDVLVLSSSPRGWTQGIDQDVDSRQGSSGRAAGIGGEKGDQKRSRLEAVPREVDDECGQTVAYPFYLEFGAPRDAVLPPTDWVPYDRSNDAFSLGNNTLADEWTYRRVATANKRAQRSATTAGERAAKGKAAVGDPLATPPGPGDVSLTAWGGDGSGKGNDYTSGYLLVGKRRALAEARGGGSGGGWAGGVNASTLAAAEQYSLEFGSWLHDLYQRRTKDGPELPLRIARERAGTRSGLSKMPYVRDTRRSVGLGGFRLTSSDVSDDPSHGTVAACSAAAAAAAAASSSSSLSSSSSSFSSSSSYPQGNPFPGEAVALGDYLYFDLHRLGDDLHCPYPKLPTLAPYFVPFRALTSDEVPNLLVAGKTMAQTFAANAATRFHPIEWATGAAAGAAASMFVAGRGEGGGGAVASTSELYASKEVLRELRDAISARHAPIDWQVCPPATAS